MLVENFNLSKNKKTEAQKYYKNYTSSYSNSTVSDLTVHLKDQISVKP